MKIKKIKNRISNKKLKKRLIFIAEKNERERVDEIYKRVSISEILLKLNRR